MKNVWFTLEIQIIFLVCFLCRDESRLKGVLIKCGIKNRKGVGQEDGILNAIVIDRSIVGLIC